MTINRMKKEYEKLGYECIYESKCWSIRKQATTEFNNIGCRESCEEYLFMLQDRQKEIENLQTI
jgi:hypothetical protein